MKTFPLILMLLAGGAGATADCTHQANTIIALDGVIRNWSPARSSFCE